MKRIFYFLLLFVFGCEVYEQPSNPQLNLNGRWDVVNINVWARSTYTTNEPYQLIPVINSDFAVVGSFYVSKISENEGTLTLTQDFEKAPIQRRFDLKTTTWEFDYYDLIINDGISNKTLPIDFPCGYCKEQTKIKFFDLDGTNYTFSIDTYGAMPSNVLKLTSQVFYTDIFNSNGQFDKAVESHLEITLHRF